MRIETIGAVGMLVATLFAATVLTSRTAPAQVNDGPAPGQLTIMQKDGKVGDLCPLKKTTVNADVSGFGARVTVVQDFTNPSKEAIEAVYTFPLPNDASVDQMQMVIGNRVIEGEIKKREDARKIYDAAKQAGQSAALLDQERPNIFTQSVANIMPGAKVQIRISYVQLLKFENGQFEFNFPMVVGPRFLGNAPDPGKIAPPVTPKGTRTGANIDITVNLDAGAPIQSFNSVLHKVNVKREGDDRAQIKLAKADEIPNKDFILRYQTATDSIQDAFITHMGSKGGFFSLVLLPPKAPKATQIAPKEIIFVMDQSGSQNGFPLDKSKELTLKLIKTLRPGDTFNVLGFSNDVRSLWPSPRPNTPENMAEAEKYVQAMQANGGTQLRSAVESALMGQTDPKRLRLVVFNTDGYVGDEAAILDCIQKRRDTSRMFTFGIGNSVNRYLIDSMSLEGKGDAEYVTLAEAADGAVQRFIDRTSTPVLTDVSARFEGVQVDDSLPEALPDVFSGKPVVITGRYATAGHGRVTITGKLGGQPWSKTIELDFPAQASAPALESLWARKKVEDLERHNYFVSTRPEVDRNISDEITRIALEFGIMTQYTSFVAVEKRIVNVGGKQRTVAVPVEQADGVSFPAPTGLSLNYRSASSAGLMRGGFGGGTVTAAKALPVNEKLSDMALADPKAREKAVYETKVEKSLREATGKVEIQILMTKLDDEILAKLKKLGLKIDDSDKGLKVVFGSCDAKILKELAKLTEVDKITKL